VSVLLFLVVKVEPGNEKRADTPVRPYTGASLLFIVFSKLCQSYEKLFTSAPLAEVRREPAYFKSFLKGGVEGDFFATPRGAGSLHMIFKNPEKSLTQTGRVQ
jgi:hypothetical protein